MRMGNFSHPARAGRAAAASLIMFACVIATHAPKAQFCGDVAHYDAKCKDPSKSYYEDEWRESKTPLPPTPEDDNLRPIDADRADER